MGDTATQLDQLIGRLPHGRDDHNKIVSRLALPRDPRRDALDVVGGGDGTPAVLLHPEHRRYDSETMWAPRSDGARIRARPGMSSECAASVIAVATAAVY